jgi:hypothetical protein
MVPEHPSRAISACHHISHLSSSRAHLFRAATHCQNHGPPTAAIHNRRVHREGQEEETGKKQPYVSSDHIRLLEIAKRPLAAYIYDHTTPISSNRGNKLNRNAKFVHQGNLNNSMLFKEVGFPIVLAVIDSS